MHQVTHCNRHINISLHLSVVSAHGFEYNDLYITAHLRLPECELSPTPVIHLEPMYLHVYMYIFSLGAGRGPGPTMCCNSNLQNKVKALGMQRVQVYVYVHGLIHAVQYPV